MINSQRCLPNFSRASALKMLLLFPTIQLIIKIKNNCNLYLKKGLVANNGEGATAMVTS